MTDSYPMYLVNLFQFFNLEVMVLVTLFGLYNIYHMLSYSFQILKEEAFTEISERKLATMGDLVASIMSKGIKKQVAKGLDKQYITKTELLSTMRGSINVSETMKGFTMVQKKLVCDYDEFSIDSYMNRILKAAATYLINSDDIKPDLRMELSRNMIAFVEVSDIDTHSINWSQLVYHKNNQMYKMLMNLSYIVLMSMKKNRGLVKSYLESYHMQALYTRFIVEYIRYWYPSVEIELPSVNIDEATEAPISVFRMTDVYIILKYGKRLCFLGVPFYDVELFKEMQKQPQEILRVDLDNLQKFGNDVIEDRHINTHEYFIQMFLLHGQFQDLRARKIRSSSNGILLETQAFDLGSVWYYVELQLNRLMNRVFGESLRRKIDSGSMDSRARTASGALIGTSIEPEW